MDGPAVGIIMSGAQAPVLVARAFGSVVAQRHENWRLFVSVDPAQMQDEIADLFKTNEPGFRGRATIVDAARPLEDLVRASDTPYLAFHDCKDTWHPRFLQEAAAFLDRDRNAQYAGAVTGWTSVDERVFATHIEPRKRKAHAVAGDRLDGADLFGGTLPPFISLVARRKALEAAAPIDTLSIDQEQWIFILALFSIGDIGVVRDDLAFVHTAIDRDEEADEDRGLRGGNALLRRAMAKDERMVALTRAVHRFDRHRRERIDDLTEQVSMLSTQLEDMRLSLTERIDMLDLGMQKNLTDQLRYVPQATAVEVWFERQRWGLPYKVTRALRGLRKP